MTRENRLLEISELADCIVISDARTQSVFFNALCPLGPETYENAFDGTRYMLDDATRAWLKWMSEKPE